jgi:hypothetical protein
MMGFRKVRPAFNYHLLKVHGFSRSASARTLQLGVVRGVRKDRELPIVFLRYGFV